MRFVKNILVVLVALAWLPASSHPLLEYAGLIHEFHADHDTDSNGSHEHDDDHDAADGLCAPSSPHVNVPTPHFVATALPPGLIVSDQGWLRHDSLRPSGPAPPGTAPPQLSSGWQFSFRAALPAREPSFVS